MIDFRFPSLGADMDSGLLVEWRVKPGDEVHRGDIIAEVETDKGLVEIECWVDGRVVELLAKPSRERIAVGTPIALLELLEVGAAEEGRAPEPALPEEPVPVKTTRTTPEPAQVTPPIRHLAHELGVDLDTVKRRPDGSLSREDIYRAAERAGRGIKASPLARRKAEELGVDITTVESRRKDGLITVEDVISAAGARLEISGEQPPATTGVAEDRLLAMRSAIARSMARSKREIPHYYLGTRIDLDAATRWLDDQNERRPLAERVLPAALLLRAAALALREVPEFNGHWIDGEFRSAQEVHLGVAVSLREGGLVAPAIHHADRLSLDALMAALVELVTRARAGRLRSSEMSDPTITVTNLGDRGVETVLPVIIPPQVAMVGFGRIADHPVAVGGMLAVHPTVYLTLAADHRVTDGHCGSVFLTVIDQLLQKPEDL